MAKGKKYTKRMAVVSCLSLSMLAMIPSYAASEGMAQMNERWIEETNVERAVEAIDYDALELHGHVTDDQEVVEIDLSEKGIEPVSTLVSLDYRQGSGSLDHVFTIDAAGEYTVYVENRSSSKTMQVTGSAIYSD